MGETRNTQEQDINQLLKVRREKLAALQENGKDPFLITKYDVTHHSLEIKEEFDAKMEKYHMQKTEVKPQSEKTTRKFEKQYLKTDTGIEINIPMEQYQDINQVEFITNPDGTISVLIKNINRISTR